MKTFKRTATAAGIGLAFCTVLVASPAMAQDSEAASVASASQSVVQPAQAQSATSTASTAAGALPVTSNASNSVRGTFVTLENNTSGTIKIGTASNTWDKAPSVNQQSVAAGQSVTESQGSSSASGTSIFAQITYPDGTSEQVSVANPSIGYPTVKVRDAKWGALDWQNANFESHCFDEGESWTANLPNGHSITFHRNSDDSAGHNFSKVWTATVS